MGWSLFRKRTLSGLTAPTRVTLAADVALQDEVVSPLSSLRAVAFHVALFERFASLERNREADPALEVVLLGERFYGDRLLLAPEGVEGVLEVPLDGARLRVRAARENVVPLEALPAWLEPLAELSTGRGALFYRETPISRGERYRVRATVEPRPPAAQDYRRAPGPAWLARPDLERVELEERLEVPGW